VREPPALPFLARPGYRRRRLIEAIRLLPYAGLLLFLFPLLWPENDGATLTSRATIYIFAAWFMLVLAAAIGARALSRAEARDDEGGGDGEPL